MKIKMLKNYYQSGKIIYQSGSEYASPKELSDDLAEALIKRGKAIELIPTPKKSIKRGIK